jgi:hypothetical protein
MPALATVEGLDEEGRLGGHKAGFRSAGPHSNHQAAVRIDYAPNPQQ